MRISTLIFTTALCALVLGCGHHGRGHHGAVKGRLESPSGLDAAAYRAPGLPRGFGDTDPHEWQGITPAHYAVHGLDASRYQGAIDWRAARQAGVSFAWLKATEGGDRVDPGFALNASAARAAGVPVGGYHFFYFCRPASEQAAWFIRNVPKVAGDLPPVLDIEWNPDSPSCKARPDAATVRAEMRSFLSLLERHYGTQPVVYTTPDFYKDNDLGSLSGVDFWLRAVTAHPSERYPGERWTFWQYTGTGVVPGVGGIVDINAFAGSRAAWGAWLAARAQR
ncbi:GH25 family lysozyme [Rhodobacter capsulatus]|uniref:GH25 family lysozyme n=1 Tax=Rhodobacter capsulatus TaxID=1061 RepID=UPI0003D35B87|nr:GH25 family lysozyme [Rhodobacter capsulatus]ETD83325.1 glycoside hydrolase [Rhodobacter capsulatus B6]